MTKRLTGFLVVLMCACMFIGDTFIGCDTNPAPSPATSAKPATRPPEEVVETRPPRRPRVPYPPAVETRTPAQINIAACTAADGSWRCASPKPKTVMAAGTRPPIIPYSWTITTWFIDPANTSTTASDSNNCTSTGTPCLTFSEIAARWGTYSPILRTTGTITITIMSSQSATQAVSDPMTLRPFLGGNGGTLLRVTGTPTATVSATITSVTAKNRNTPVALTVNFGATTVTAFQLLTNTTHPSTSMALTTSTNAIVAQPINLTLGAGFSATEVNTWTGGDSVTVATLPLFHIVDLEPTIEIMGEGETSFVQVDNITILGNAGSSTPQEGPGDSSLLIGHNVLLGNGSSIKNVNVTSTDMKNGQASLCGSGNFAYQAGFQGGLRGTNENAIGAANFFGWSFLGGFIQPANGGAEFNDFDGVLLDCDIRLKNSSSYTFNNVNYLAAVELEGSAFVNSGVLDIQNGSQCGTTPNYVLWGAGTLDSARGNVYYPAGATAGASTFLGTLAISSLAVGCVFNPAAVVTTITCNKAAASGANLDTALGTAVVGCLGTGASGFCNTPF